MEAYYPGMSRSTETEQKPGIHQGTQPESERNSGRWSPKKLLRGALIGAGFGVSLAVTALGVYRFLNGDPEGGHLAKLALVGTGAGFGAVINGAGAVRDTIYKHFWADVFNIPHRNYD